MSDIIYIPVQSDKTIFNCFKNIAIKCDIKSLKIEIYGTHSKDISITDDVSNILEHNTILIKSLVLTFDKDTKITFTRGTYSLDNREQKDSALHDIIKLDKSSSENYKSKIIDIVSTIQKELKAFNPDRIINAPLSLELEQLYSLHNSMLERLETLNAELIIKSEQYRENLEKTYIDKQNEVEQQKKDFQDKLSLEHKKRSDELNKKEDELNRKFKEIDDREHTHARRQLRKDLLNEINERSKEFSLTRGTNKLRLPIHAACITLFILLIYGTIYYSQDLFNYIKTVEQVHTLPLLVLTLKQIGLTLGAGATAFFYIKWLNRWFEQHSQAEFQLKQLQLDIERASWIVETSLEWKESEGSSMPIKLLESLSKNLFSNEEHKSIENASHPADMLASALIGTAASKVKVKTDNAEIEFDGKKLNTSKKQKPYIIF